MFNQQFPQLDDHQQPPVLDGVDHAERDERLLSLFAATNVGVVVLVTANPVPNVGVVTDDVDRSVASSDRNGTASRLMTTLVCVAQLVVAKNWCCRILKECLERLVCQLLNPFRKLGKHFLVIRCPYISASSDCND